MAITDAYNGSSVTIGATEWSLTTNTSGPDATVDTGIFQIFLDLNLLVAGDLFELRVYEKVLSGSTQRLVFVADFAGVQGTANWVSPSLVLIHGWDATLIKISGTDHVIDWSIRKVA